MIKSSKGVIDFLDDLEKKLVPVGKKDVENLLKLKKEEHKVRNLPFDNECTSRRET